MTVSFVGGTRVNVGEDQYVNADAREHVVLVEPSAQGVLVLGAQPDGASAIVVIPWDQAVGVSRRILQLAPNRDDVR
jgi:hypothetical protein